MTEQSGGDIAQNARTPEPRINVVGVGGAGGNGVNNMINAGLEGVEFLVVNTDGQALDHSLCKNRIQLGLSLTKGLGAGSRPEVGKAAAEEAHDAISQALKGSDMAFIAAGMGGGTGTGAAPVIAQIAREQGVLTVGVVTRPFTFEGAHRMRQAEAGIAELARFVDTLIVIPNQNLFKVADANTTFADAFKLADEVLHFGVRGVTDLVVLPGLVNLDFADVRAIMTDMGKAVMGTGEAEGENRALAAAEAAISNPLIGDVSMRGARNVIINITGGLDLMLMEVDEAANRIREEVDPDANIIFGSAFSSNLEGKIRVSVIATGNDIEFVNRAIPVTNRASTGGLAGGLSIASPAIRHDDDAVEPVALHEEEALTSEESALAPEESDPPSGEHELASDETVSTPTEPALPEGLSLAPEDPKLVYESLALKSEKSTPEREGLTLMPEGPKPEREDLTLTREEPAPVSEVPMLRSEKPTPEREDLTLTPEKPNLASEVPMSRSENTALIGYSPNTVETAHGTHEHPAPLMPTSSSEETSTRRTVSTLSTSYTNQGPSQSETNRQTSELVTPFEAVAEAAAEKTALSHSNNIDEEVSIPNPGTEIGVGLPKFLHNLSDPATGTSAEGEAPAVRKSVLGRPFRSLLRRNVTDRRKPRFRRKAKPVKSENTLEAFENALRTFRENRRQEPQPRIGPEKTHYLVWQIESGARIYKIKEGDLGLVKRPPDADKLKMFDDLEKAKEEAVYILKRVTANRAARGLPSVASAQSLQDLMSWKENNVPDYFV